MRLAPLLLLLIPTLAIAEELLSATDTSSHQQVNPRACGPGTFFRRNRCVACPPGTFQPSRGATSCTPCPAGTYLPVSGGVGLDTCIQCPDNTFNPNESAASLSDCRPCPDNTRSTPDSTRCISCAEGFIFTNRGCRRCSAFEVPFEGANRRFCSDCPDGNQVPVNGVCSDCPVGTRANINRCVPCSGRGGEFGDGTFPGCATCRPGFRGFPARRATSCRPCPAGTTAMFPPPGFGRACRPCRNGQNEGVIGALVCQERDTPCPANFFLNRRGACDRCTTSERFNRRRRECVPCEENFASSGGFDSRCRRCRAPAIRSLADKDCICPPGTILSENGECELCPAGTEAGGKNGRTCFECNPGYFAPNPGSSECTPCPPGTVATGPGNARCTPCPEGLIATFYRRFLGLQLQRIDDASECVLPQTLCPPGQTRVNHINGNRVACNPSECPAGTFRVVIPAVSRRECQGSIFCPVEPVIYCTICPRTHRYDPRTNSCLICRANALAGGLKQRCTDCPSGQREFNSECACRSQRFDSSRFSVLRRGLSRGVLNGTCQVCPPGSFGTNGIGVCKACPAGTFQSEAGQYSCETCPTNTMSSEGATSCERCPRGTITYEFDGIGSSTCVRPGSSAT